MNYDTLTQKEKEILGYSAEGYSIDQIARKKFVASTTLKGYLEIIYDKLKIQGGERHKRILAHIIHWQNNKDKLDIIKPEEL